MSAVTVLAELVAGLEAQANSLQAAQSGNEAQLRAASKNAAVQLLNFKQKAAMVLAAVAAGPAAAAPPASLLGYADSSVSSIGGVVAAPPVPKALPSGPAAAFDRDNLAAVVQHMSIYEGSASESAKALRALGSLAYANASSVGDHPEALPQVFRVLSLHPTEENLQLNGMRTLCNVAYDAKVALERLSSLPALAAFVQAMARKPQQKEINTKASEAVARVIAAEVGPERPSNAPTVPWEQGPLTALFTVVPSEDAAGREVVVDLVKQLISNEVATTELLVERLYRMHESATQSGPAAAAWLLLSKQIAMAEIGNMSELLITKNGINGAARVMIAQKGHAGAQLAGIEAMSGLVGSRWIGLQAFAAVKGIERIEEAMGAHPDEAVLQTKGIRALASGIQWPEDIQSKACYNFRNGVTLTKAAMSRHGDIEELQIAGLEALSKYLDKQKCIDDVKADGGPGLVKAVIARHGSVEKVKTVGGTILEALGEKDWKPKGLA